MRIFGGRRQRKDERMPRAATPAPAVWSGRPLRLKHPPEPEHMAELAQDFADAALSVDGVELDYSQASLDRVDELLGTWEPDGSDAMAESVFVAGAYTGEVMVREHGYRWAATPDELQPVIGFPIAVRGPGGNWANPLAKAFKRVDNGSVDNIPYFVRVMTSRPADEGA